MPPTDEPTIDPQEDQPTFEPTLEPVQPTLEPVEPTFEPVEPTLEPVEPTFEPTEPATNPPTNPPTEQQTQVPNQSPSEPPTQPPPFLPQPTEPPTAAPNDAPSNPPTPQPTEPPTETPTNPPTPQPTQPPTEQPTQAPTCDPDTLATTLYYVELIGSESITDENLIDAFSSADDSLSKDECDPIVVGVSISARETDLVTETITFEIDALVEPAVHPIESFSLYGGSGGDDGAFFDAYEVQGPIVTSGAVLLEVGDASGTRLSDFSLDIDDLANTTTLYTGYNSSIDQAHLVNVSAESIPNESVETPMLPPKGTANLPGFVSIFAPLRGSSSNSRSGTTSQGLEQTGVPTLQPTREPTPEPTVEPTVEPSRPSEQTTAPTLESTMEQTAEAAP
ncbi:thaumatin-like protein [Seminavis robusta]|uniref:Thaumatin-like protein n=1 Tax=Seminavis robusta TaxID=568900 RepID=A0A9N8DX77_9STRA|nr:thaumatin-like protein [Seminavis robusta]|eukprot:Sro314_g115060.1 thaumatin-like protein (393) ;mRNA; r:30036-31414